MTEYVIFSFIVYVSSFLYMNYRWKVLCTEQVYKLRDMEQWIGYSHEQLEHVMNLDPKHWEGLHEKHIRVIKGILERYEHTSIESS